MIRTFVVALLLSVPDAGWADGLTAAHARQQQLQEQLQAAADELAALQARTAELEARRDELARELSALQIQLEGSQARLDDRVRRLYIRGETSPTVLLLAADSPTDAKERAAFAARLIRDDRAAIQQVSAQRRQVTAVASRLGQQQQTLDEASRRQQEVSTRLQQGFEEAAAVVVQLEEEQRREEEARRLEGQRVEEQRRLDELRRLDEQRRREETERRRLAEEPRRSIPSATQRQAEKAVRAQPPALARPQPLPPRPPPAANRSPEGRYACPVVQPRAFSDTWGAPRSGGRRHQGTDIFAPRGSNVVAIVNGVIDLRGYGESAGWWLSLRGDDGTSYWYLHLQRYAIADGARVSAGQLIAHNGDTGNAQGTPPHVHFEQHPGGGAAVNPYPLLKRSCG